MPTANEPLKVASEQQAMDVTRPGMGNSLLAVSSRKIVVMLVLTSFLLLAGNLLSIYLTYTGKKNTSLLYWYLAEYFDFNVEANFPSFFATMLLMFAALLLGITFWFQRVTGGRDRMYWGFLTLLFLFLSLDENIQFHEKIAEHLTPRLPTDLNGFIYWSWVVPYSVLVLAAGLFFLAFVWRLPALTRWLVLISGLMFISGAFGLELLEGYFFKLYGIDHIINKVLYCIEELLEMLGVILFLYALLEYMKAANIHLSFSKGGS